MADITSPVPVGTNFGFQSIGGIRYPFAARATQTNRTTPTATITEKQLIAAGGRTRMGVSVVNASNQTLYLACGSTAATLTNYTVPIAPGGYWETPFEYAGEIRGIWGGVSVAGNAMVTEYIAAES